MATLVFERLDQLNLTGNIANFGENMEKKNVFMHPPTDENQLKNLKTQTFWRKLRNVLEM